MASFYTKFEFDEDRSKDLALAIAEFIVTYSSPQNLAIKLEKNACSIFYEAIAKDEREALDLKQMLSHAKVVGEFCYEVTTGDASTKRTIGEILNLFDVDKEEVALTPQCETPDLPKEPETEVAEKVISVQEESVKNADESDAKKDESSTTSKVLNLINELEDGKSLVAKEIAQRLGIENPQKVAFTLTSLSKTGRIIRVSRGRYAKKVDPSIDKKNEEAVKKQEGTDKKHSEVSSEEETKALPRVVTKVSQFQQPVINKAKVPKNFVDLTDIPNFEKVIEELDFSNSREENVRMVLEVLYAEEMPDEEVQNDLFVRSTIAVTIVRESVKFETINANLEDFDTGVSEKSKAKADVYLRKVFGKLGYTVSYLKFLMALNEAFMQKYKGVKLAFQVDTERKRLKMKSLPENEEFEVFLARLAKEKGGKLYISQKLLEFLKGHVDLPSEEYDDILEVLLVSYDLKVVTEDFIFVNGNFKSSRNLVVSSISRLINKFVQKISNGKMKEMSYIKFLNEFYNAIRSYSK